jgi:hypothetical protein
MFPVSWLTSAPTLCFAWFCQCGLLTFSPAAKWWMMHDNWMIRCGGYEKIACPGEVERRALGGWEVHWIAITVLAWSWSRWRCTWRGVVWVVHRRWRWWSRCLVIFRFCFSRMSLSVLISVWNIMVMPLCVVHLLCIVCYYTSYLFHCSSITTPVYLNFFIFLFHVIQLTTNQPINYFLKLMTHTFYYFVYSVHLVFYSLHHVSLYTIWQWT